MTGRAEQGASWLPLVCRKKDLVVMFGVSMRLLSDLDQRGILVRGAQKGTFRTVESMHAYLEDLRKKAAGRGTSTGQNLADERAESEKVKRQIEEIKLAKLKGEVLLLDEVSKSWSGFASILKSMVIAIPTKARQTIPHMTAHDAETLRDLCRDVLNDAADEIEDSVIGGDGDNIKA